MSGMAEGSSLADLLDSRRLFQFVVAAEAPTLAAAAAQLFITQQALSSAIRQLERDLGVALFSRAQRSLQLTDAGHELYTGAKPLLAGIRVLANATRNLSDPQRAFVIGHSPAISGEEVYRIVEPAVISDPAVSITVRQVFPSSMRDGLLDGSLDLALRRGIDMPTDLATDTLLYQPLRIAVVQSHPLAAQERVNIAEIAECPIVVWAPPRHSFYTDLLVSHCRRSGFEPRLLINPVQGTPPHTAVLAHPDHCAFVTDDPGDLYHRKVRVIEIVNPPLVPIQAVWLPHSVSTIRTKLFEGVQRSTVVSTLAQPEDGDIQATSQERSHVTHTSDVQ
ncbi:LysR family transcriptional regulator [Mycobacteroides franklinii]|uniref:HTH-type transcriptional regulator CynR n=1 Tax=Mycobacteroides franklinii TaxID=948102 RepID=A0A4R8R5R9_9MYCO|nr:LysR family transcriptional regulator [Mycobacteroides franklinii]TDZ44322.1 HTH-type transcriptional regulator CynR [Mycobacteroides franklinii]TDZ51455.1 HTH-type transcriptional regulator CynR [Mycobacteroides franklinii]TDZ57876.1 HTH-type transcriptional regulator CynR [Mycobacteroides franklinii]TDZ64817.1 HTH-type transcriptional regulator CynR [Mycobacteroides franklinii]TDZ71215.1 HTH-type transcriptional regulator CynR [Mycobacteroides franklinii]